MKNIVLSALFLIKIQCCFLIHFVYYGPVTEYDYDRLTNFNFPYIFHLNEPITLPDNYKLNRTLTPVEKSDVKKMQVIYHHGGLYLDNDHLIDTQCIQKIFCPLKDGMYLLDWTDRGGQSWYKAVPISFIFASHPKNPTIYKIITTYNESIPDTIYFSGPFHAQSVRDEIKFVKVERSCEYHIGIQSWNKEKNLQYNWITRKWDEFKKADMTNPLQIKRAQEERQLFEKLWASHSVIYPHNFDYDSFEAFNPNFNHIEIVDKRNLKFKVVKYAQIEQIKRRAVAIEEFYKDKEITVMQSFQQLQQQKKKEEQQQENGHQQLLPLVSVGGKAQSQKQQKSDQQPQNKPNGNNGPKESKQQIKNVEQEYKQYKQYPSSPLKFFLQLTFAIFTLIFLTKLIMYMAESKEAKDEKHLKKRVSDEAEYCINQKIQHESAVQQQQRQNKLINGWLWSIGAYLLILVFIILIDDQPTDQKYIVSTHQVANIPKQSVSISTEQPKQETPVVAEVKQTKQQKLEVIEEPALSKDEYREHYGIKWSPILDYQLIQNNIGIKDLGIYYDVHINSKFDFLNLTIKPKFKQFSQDFMDNLKYTTFQFDFNKSLQRQKKLMNYTEFWTEAQLETALEHIQKLSQGPQLPHNTETYLAKYLAYKKDSLRIKQLQHYYFNKKYQIDSIQKQQPICVIATVYEIAIKSHFENFFQSIQNQNYSNYRVVLVDDHSSNKLASHWFNYLKHRDYNLKNRIKIVRNHEQIGILASNYAYVKKFCQENDIVVSMKVEDSLLGFQTFNVLNSVYQDPNIWYAYSKELQEATFQSDPKFGAETNLITGKWEDYRIGKQWNTSGLRTYRQQLMQKTPIEQFIEYQYDNNTNMMVPKFPLLASDRYQAYSHLEMAGPNRTKLLEQALYLSHDPGIGKPCQIEEHTYFQYKARSKRSIKPLKSFDDEIQYFPHKNYTKRFIINFRDSYNILNRCKGIFSMQQNLM